MTTIYILLGANLGDKESAFTEAKELIGGMVGQIMVESAIYETEPWGFESADLFWNQALMIGTKLLPELVLDNIQQIENKLGRIRNSTQYDSRAIDIDILFYGNQVINEERLTVPHPRIQDRNFVLIPLNEIAPDFEHPIFRQTIRQMMASCTDLLKVEKVVGK